MIMLALWARETEVQTRHSPDLTRHCPETPAPARGGWRILRGRAASLKLSGCTLQGKVRGGAVVAEAVGLGKSHRLLGPFPGAG